MQKQAIVDKYSNIDGDYEATVLQGVWHAYCDSGIMTDALSVEDAERCERAGLYEENEDGERAIDSMCLDEINAAVRAADNGSDLDCVQCINAITALGVDIEEFFDDAELFG